MTKPLIRFLLPHPRHTTSMTLSDPSTPKSFITPLLETGLDSEADLGLGGHDVPRPNSLRALLRTPTRSVHRYWRKFDDAFMRPMFGGRGFVPFVPGSPTERNIPPPQWQWGNKGAHCIIVCTLCISGKNFQAMPDFRSWFPKIFAELLGGEEGTVPYLVAVSFIFRIT